MIFLKDLNQEKKEDISVPITYIVAGLGNPGDKYHNTHHNMGFLALDCIEQKLGVKINRLKFKSLCADARVGDKRILLIRPQTYMNNSGELYPRRQNFIKYLRRI